jgi:hypothetical protein
MRNLESLLFIALACMLLASSTSRSSYAGIIYSDITDVYLASQCLSSYELDLDGDSFPDISFSTDAIPDLGPPPVLIREYVWTTPSGLGRVLGIGTWGELLTNGYYISSIPQESFDWFSGVDLPVHMGILDNNPPPCGEDFSGLTGFLGLEFDISGNTHYAWLRLTLHPDAGAVILRDYAYETTPGMGIVAGAIPEPSTILLLSLGGLGLLWRAGRKAQLKRSGLSQAAPTLNA